MTLMHRTTRRLQLTEEGAWLLERARAILQDLANGRADSGTQSEVVIALMEAQESVDGVLKAGQIAYVITTVNRDRPLGAVVTNDEGEVCAAVTGASKEHLAEAIRAKLWPVQEGLGECA